MKIRRGGIDGQIQCQRGVQTYTLTGKKKNKRIYTSMGYAVAQLVEALCYKPEGRRFDSRLCHWNFSLTQSFPPHYGTGVDSVSNRNEYHEYFLG